MIKKEYINKIIEVKGITSKDMLPEWNDKENKFVDREIKKLFQMKKLQDHNGNIYTMYTKANIEDFFGLPYTSSSSFAMLSNTNTIYCLDTEEKYNIDCFGLGKDGEVYIFCSDKEENIKVYKIL